MCEHIIQGKIVRSRINWYEKGKKNSKYFLNLETNKSRKTSICRLLDIDGKLILNSKGILKKLEDFHKALYSNQDSQDHEQFFPEFLENDYIEFLSVMSRCHGAEKCSSKQKPKSPARRTRVLCFEYLNLELSTLIAQKTAKKHRKG